MTKSTAAKERIRKILQSQLQQATTVLALMENGTVSTHEREVDTTKKSIANRKADIEGLKEALDQLDSLG